MTYNLTLDKIVESPDDEIENNVSSPWSESIYNVSSPWSESIHNVSSPWSESIYNVSSPWNESIYNVSSPWNESIYNVSSPWNDFIQDYNQDFSMEVYGGPPDPAPFQHVATILRMYYQPVVAGLGVLINLVTMVILLYRPLRILSCNQYMLGVLISQIIYQVTLVNSSLTDHGYSIYTLSGFCQLTTFIPKGSSFMCLWCTVGLSEDGLIRVRHPDLELHMCTLWRACIYIISICIISVVVHLNTSLTVALYYYPYQMAPLSVMTSMTL